MPVRLSRASRLSAWSFLILLSLTIAGCPPEGRFAAGDPNDIDPNAMPVGGGSGVVPTGPGGSFVYVLQPDRVGTGALAAANFDWLVLEPSRSGDTASEFSRADLDAIRSGTGCGDRKILAYLSIGEAEDYRDYWNPGWVSGDEGPPIAGVAPAWLGPSNPRWGGNYKVRYWEPAWQAVMFGTADGPGRTPLDRIIDAGFDGVYLDIVDGFEFWSDPDEGFAELTRQQARTRMIDFVAVLADYARATRGAAGFLVFPQNAEEIIYDDDEQVDSEGTRFLAIVDGIGIEDLFYADTARRSAADSRRRVATLQHFRAAGATVLVTDYVLDASISAPRSGLRVADFYQQAAAAGFLPYAAVSQGDLDEIAAFSGSDWPVSQPGTCAGP